MSGEEEQHEERTVANAGQRTRPEKTFLSKVKRAAINETLHRRINERWGLALRIRFLLLASGLRGPSGVCAENCSRTVDTAWKRVETHRRRELLGVNATKLPGSSLRNGKHSETWELSYSYCFLHSFLHRETRRSLGAGYKKKKKITWQRRIGRNAWARNNGNTADPSTIAHITSVRGRGEWRWIAVYNNIRSGKHVPVELPSHIVEQPGIPPAKLSTKLNGRVRPMNRNFLVDFWMPHEPERKRSLPLNRVSSEGSRIRRRPRLLEAIASRSSRSSSVPFERETSRRRARI